VVVAPSRFQQDIYDFVAHGDGHAFISAVAGSGKTTTFVNAMALVPTHLKVLFSAFNNSIAGVLRSRLPLYVDVFTNHKLGMNAIEQVIPHMQRNDFQYKYHDICEQIVVKNWRKGITHSKYYMRNLTLDYVHYAQVTLTNPRDKDAMKLLAEHYGLSTKYPEVFEWAAEAMDIGYRMAFETGRITFDDMLWLPNVAPMAVPQYDYIFVDEAQDLSRAQRELLLKSLKPGGRIFFVLDPAQAIYGFTGADTASVEALRALPGITELPLSVTYRCPKKHVALAKQYVPQIEAAPGADDGEIFHIPHEDIFHEVEPDDLILCRVNAPLYALCLELIDRGIPARIQGKDILKEFSTILHYVETETKYKGKTYDALLAGCKAFVKKRYDELKEYLNAETMLAEVEDQVEVVLSIARSRKIYDASAIKGVIKGLTEEKGNQVVLSSIHRAKGLEAECVFLLRPDLIPHPKATSAWERDQEENLMYVALTRSKQFYYFVEPPSKDEKKDVS
jgi:DNA helicase-2/ATP-dependent DNA helicase PcrA